MGGALFFACCTFSVWYVAGRFFFFFFYTPLSSRQLKPQIIAVGFGRQLRQLQRSKSVRISISLIDLETPCTHPAMVCQQARCESCHSKNNHQCSSTCYWPSFASLCGEVVQVKKKRMKLIRRLAVLQSLSFH